jgi:hypothetical protein
LLKTGAQLLDENIGIDKLEILADGFENSSRKVELLKTGEAYHHFKKQIIYYGVSQLLQLIKEKNN